MLAYAIDPLPVARGHIGLCCCPGHRLTPRFVRPSLEALEEDLDVIAAFGATRLVTLMEADELRYIGVDPRRLEQAASAHGLAWLHLPIRNLSIPSATWEDGWRTAGALLRQELEGGGRFAMHCYAGLGRTGTVAARLLIENGQDPRSAVAAVRRVRPGSIETWEQEDYVLRSPWVL
ncbi:MAG TPA: phosphatase [Candidatus Binatia bacterium]|nr:phosphatase [Candidatus Binatia bacterium]